MPSVRWGKTMLIIPAIDIFDNKCVRLFQGNYKKVTVYDRDIITTVKVFEDSGAKRIHVVDLNAAREGGRGNRKVIKEICKTTFCTVEAGGGIRTEDDVKELLDIGVKRLIVGTILAKDPALVGYWIEKFGSVFIAGIDACGGEVKISGWESGTGIKEKDLGITAKKIGVCSIIYTNITKDGTLKGPDIKGSIDISSFSGLPVIVSGGISSAADIKKIKDRNQKGLVGVITGRAIYDGKIILADVIKKYQEEILEEVDW